MLWILVTLLTLVLLFYACDFFYASHVASRAASYEAGLPRDKRGMIHGQEAFQRQAGKKACLLIHGYRGSPEVFRELTQTLESENVSVSAILLPGHGRSVRDLEGVRWTHWVAAVESAYLHLKEQHEDVFVVGFSLGGLLGLHLACRHPVAGVVAISPFFKVHSRIAARPGARLAALLSRFLIFTRIIQLEREPDIRDPSGKEKVKPNPFYPLSTTRSLMEFAKRFFEEAHRVRCPLLVLQSRDDRVVEVSAVEAFFERAASERKQLYWFEDSGHELLLDRERLEVSRKVADFMRTGR